MLNIGKICVDTDFHINSNVLPVVKHCRDLGVTISHNLQSSEHINIIVAKAHQRANAILRCFISRDTNLLVRAFNVYVRPLVEYNSVTWSPYLKQDIEAIERVQRCFTKRLPGLNKCSYCERLARLNLPSLELRRLQNDLVWCYKILFGYVDMRADEFFECRLSNTRGHDYKLYKKRNNNNVRANFFAERIVNVWNRLPGEIVNFDTLSSFNRTVKLVDLSEFLKCF